MTAHADTLYWEDLAAGQVYPLGSVTVDEDEMLDFARRYDPQPFHTDPVAAKDTHFGGLIASGWYTFSLFMRLYVDGLLCRAASEGSPGGDEFGWLAPVRAGDTLAGRITVLETRPSRRHPERGLATILGELLRDDEPVARCRFVGLFGRRPH
jgi:acyl dehydratase